MQSMLFNGLRGPYKGVPPLPWGPLFNVQNVRYNPTLVFDFANGQSLTSQVGGVTLTYAQAGGLTGFNVAGLLITPAANTPIFDYDQVTHASLGLSIWPAATNRALWNRDLTNVVWVKTTLTATKDQTGIDGAANSATRLTATAGNALALQAVVLGSSARAQSAYVKRITGSGTIEMTTDNGTTWTAITVTAGYARVFCPLQTVTNPVFGFRIVTSGDEIAVDYVQNELTAFTPAIATTTANVTRATVTQCFSINLSFFNATQGTLYAEIIMGMEPGNATNRDAITINDDTDTNRITLRGANGGTIVASSQITGGANPGTATSTALVAGVPSKLVTTYRQDDLRIFKDGVQGVNDNAVDMVPISSFTHFQVGLARTTGTRPLTGWLQRVKYFPLALSQEQARILSI